jgi:hypothetical protein
MRKSRIIIWVISFLAGHALFGCQSQPIQPNLFDTSPCKAPCWENITPGVTSEQDALAIFAKFADSRGVSDTAAQDSRGYDNNISLSSPTGRGSIYANTLNGRISTMKFEGSFDGPLTLQHAIELFGEPESVLVMEGSMYDEIRLYNPVKGIALGWLISGSSPSVASGQAEIGPNSGVGLVWFFDPNESDRFLNAYGFISLTKDDMHPWAGYGKVSDKYWPPVLPSP